MKTKDGKRMRLVTVCQAWGEKTKRAIEAIYGEPDEIYRGATETSFSFFTSDKKGRVEDLLREFLGFDGWMNVC